MDKETSGVLIVAKTREYAQLFTSLFRIRKIHKTYIALAHGNISKNKLVLKDNLILYENGKKLIQKAISNLRVLKTSDKLFICRIKSYYRKKTPIKKTTF